MPALATSFASEVDSATALADAGEELRVIVSHDTKQRSLLSTTRMVLLYELAYLRLFLAWEVFLEESFLRYLCGYTSAHGQDVPKSGNYAATIAAARAALYGDNDFLLWHNVDQVVKRANVWFQHSRHDIVLSSNQGRVRHFAAVRHRVAHAQEDARTKFDAATMALVGRRYPASRPGRFLRDWVPGASPPNRWLYEIARDLRNLAYQITP